MDVVRVFDVVLSDESVFERKVSELCRELGGRVRADVGAGSSSMVVSGPSAAGSDPKTDAKDADAGIVALRMGLGGLKLWALRKRAAGAGVSEEAIDGAEDIGDEARDGVVLLGSAA